jgi:hypothetical protein
MLMCRLFVAATRCAFFPSLRGYSRETCIAPGSIRRRTDLRITRVLVQGGLGTSCLLPNARSNERFGQHRATPSRRSLGSYGQVVQLRCVDSNHRRCIGRSLAHDSIDPNPGTGWLLPLLSPFQLGPEASQNPRSNLGHWSPPGRSIAVNYSTEEDLLQTRGGLKGPTRFVWNR